MNKNLKGIDLIMVSNAQIALHRLALGYTPESVNWKPIREFRDVLSKICDDSSDPDTQTLLGEVLRESHGNHPGRRRADKQVVIPKEIVDEFDSLINNRPLASACAERLYGFCHFFYRHIDEKRNTASLIPQAVTA